MKRREFITTTAAGAIGLMLKGITSATDSPRGKNPPKAGMIKAGVAGPNILFIMTDQQHSGMMSCT